MAISVEIDKSFSDELDEMINEIELNIQKTMSVEELEKYKKYPFLATSKSQIIESLIEEIELSPSLKQKIINELSEESSWNNQKTKMKTIGFHLNTCGNQLA